MIDFETLTLLTNDDKQHVLGNKEYWDKRFELIHLASIGDPGEDMEEFDFVID